MRLSFAIAAILLLASSPASAQGLDATVPGLGKLQTTVGLAAQIQPDCTGVAIYPPGGVRAPYTLWALTYFGVGALQQNRQVHVGIKITYPTGAPYLWNSGSTFEAGTESRCIRHTVTSEGEPGEHFVQFFLDRVEIGRLTVRFSQRR
jgi:hypothetical protein